MWVVSPDGRRLIWERYRCCGAPGSPVSHRKDGRLTQNRAILAFSRSRKTQNIPKRVTNGEPNDLGWEKDAPAVNESSLSVEGGASYIRKNQKGLRAPGFGPVLGFEEGDERGPFVGREPSQSLRF